MIASTIERPRPRDCLIECGKHLERGRMGTRRKIVWQCVVSAGGASRAYSMKRETAFYIISVVKGGKTKGKENYLNSWWTNEEASNSNQPNRVLIFVFWGTAGRS